MNIRPFESSQGEITAFIPEFNYNVTFDVAHNAASDVASRPDCPSHRDPAGTLTEAFERCSRMADDMLSSAARVRP